MRFLGALQRQARPYLLGKTAHYFQSPGRYLSTTSAMAGQFLKYDVQNDVAVVTFDAPNSKVNTLGREVMEEFKDVFNQVQKDAAVKSVVIVSAKPGCFIAGADIDMLSGATSAEEGTMLSSSGQQVMQQIEDSQKPVVAAIMGSCLGGGLEVALATHYRIAVSDAKTVLGVPEVMLGLLPGAGGTQRLPKLVSIANAFDMMLTGKNIRPDKAKKMGLVDQIIKPLGPGAKKPNEATRDYLEEVAIQTARGLADGTLKKSPKKKGLQDKVMDFALKYPMGQDFFFNQVRSKVMKQSQGLYPAPLSIIDIVKTTLTKGTAEGYKAEAQLFGELTQTDVSKSLIGLFHGQTACKKNNYGTPQRKTERLAVVGAGLMGAGIVQVSIDKGIHTILNDNAQSGLIRGQQQIEKGLKTQVKKKKITSFEGETILSNLDSSLNYDGFKNVDMVIEAVFEDIEIKKKIVQALEKHIPEHCIFASNTSALPISDIAKASKRPEKVIGMHYFSPVDKMQLLEIVITDQTSQDTIATAVDVGLRQGKVIIVVKDGPGFYTTRCVASLMSESFKLLQEGVGPKDLDKRCKNIGFPVGVATLLDEVGIDVGAHISVYLSKVFGERLGFGPKETAMIEEMAAKGYLGRKSGKGVYMYEEGSKSRVENPGAQEILKANHVEPKVALTDENIRMRLLGRFVNEAALCLQEEIIRDPLEGDIGLVFGLGFPPQLGGPFRFLDSYGADKFVSQMEGYAAAYGAPFVPAQIIKDYAASGKKFHSK